MNEIIASFDSVEKRYGEYRALSGVTAEIKRGDIVGVLGKNGAGKTTLLELLLGFSPASAGASNVMGDDSFTLSAAVKSKIGFVPQQDELVDTITGKQQLHITASLHAKWNKELIDRLVAEWDVPISRRVQHMSLGERQKLSVLSALGHEPELLILDEPVASLDPIARRNFIKTMLEVAEHPERSIVFSTHIVSDIERIANTLWILKDGKLFWQGPMDKIKESVAKLHIRARQDLPKEIGIPALISKRINGSTVVLTTNRFDQINIADIESRLNASVEIERLSLEDIFVELHA